MTESSARELYDRLATELNMPAGWRLEFDSSKRRFGCCNYTNKVISLSRALVALNDEKTVGSTIRHEIAHALIGPGHGHDWVWKAMAIKCGNDGRRCYDHGVEMPEAPWQATCKRCSAVAKRHRAPKPGQQHSCGKCSSRFDPSNVLAFAPTAMAVAHPTSTDATVLEVLRLRATGMGYVAIDARFGIFRKKGWWSWKIVKENS